MSALSFQGPSTFGQTVGLLDYGRFGHIMAEYGNGYRMRVIACDRRAVAVPSDVELVDIETLLHESDVLSIHIHLTPGTTFSLDTTALAQMKPDAILLNTSRGAIVDEAALITALEAGQLGGAGLDVAHGEWDENLAEHASIRYEHAHQTSSSRRTPAASLSKDRRRLTVSPPKS